MRAVDRSLELYKESCELFPGGVNSPVRAFRSVGGTPFVVERGEGAYLYDVDDNRYVDFICSWGPLVLGHAHKVAVDAMTHQLRKGTTYGACAVPEMALGALIREYIPSIEKIRFVSSGTEAGMSVLRLARAATGRPAILKFEGCYHGHADSLLVKAGSGVATFGLPDSPGVTESLAAQTLTVPFNDIPAVEKVLQEKGEEIAALILEPVVGNSGFILPDEGFLEALRSLTESYGILLIFDEVMTGFRVAKGGAQTAFGIVPDLTMLGKVIGGGLPVGAFGGKKELMDMLAPEGPVYQAGTLSGNPLAMVAGVATLEKWLEADNFERTADAASDLVKHLQLAADRAEVPLVSRSMGTMFGFFFSEKPVRNFHDAKAAHIERFKHFFLLMLDRGVFFAPSAFEAGFLSFAHIGEPLEHTKGMIDEVMPLLKDTLS